MIVTDLQQDAPADREHRINIAPSKAAVLGRDSDVILSRIAVVLQGLATLRGAEWAVDPDGVVYEPDARDWASVISALTELGEINAAVMAGAVREHARRDGTVEDLGHAMGVVRGTAQNRRQKWIGTTENPIGPGQGELWARTGEGSPGFVDEA